MTPDSHSLSPAAAAFAEYLSMHERGEQPDFEAFCTAHASLAPALRRLHARWRELSLALAEPTPSVSQRLAARFSDDVDPAIALDDQIPSSVESGGRATRYIEGDVVARGGMGEIRRVFDRDLRRSLAMKVLLQPDDAATAPRSDPRALSRFLEEAQLTAQLYHPGIVPVHELGLDGDGRVYFTMTLVRGQSLEEVFRLVRSESDDWTRTRALHVLLRTCEAVAYAHDKRVIHRDLKPANVMVGRFGETYVMDWGLARVLGREDRKDIRLRTKRDTSISTIDTVRRDAVADAPDSPLVTMDGDVVGTPAFMPPEQARGDIERVGPQADVYSIGAMLYQLLSGQMPYVPAGARVSARTVLQSVLAGPPQALADIAADVPAELAAICRKAMAREPEDRYANVVELAGDLRAYLENRVVTAHQTGAWAELRKWVQRNRVASVAAAAVVVALGLGLALSLVQKDRADSQAELALANSRLAFEAIDRMLSHVADEKLKNVPQTESVRRELLAEALVMLESLEARGNDPSLRREVAKAHVRTGHVQRSLGDYGEALATFRRAGDLLESHLERTPDDRQARWDLASARQDVGDVLLRAGEPEQALRTLRSAVSLAGRLLAEGVATDDPSGHAIRLACLESLIFVFGRLGQHDAMLDAARELVAGRRRLAEDHPDERSHRHQLASAEASASWAFGEVGQLDDAIIASQRSIGVFDSLLELDPTDREYRNARLVGVNRLATLYMRQNRYPDVVALLREEVAVARALVADYPESVPYRGLLSMLLANLGGSLHQSGETAAGAPVVSEALDESKQARALAPDDASLQRSWVNQHYMIISILNELGRYEAAAGYAEDLAAMPFGGTRPRELAAWFLAACAGHAAKDRRADLHERYAQRSLTVLEQAVDQGYRDKTLFDEKDFDSIRDRAGFERLRQRVEGAADR